MASGVWWLLHYDYYYYSYHSCPLLPPSSSYGCAYPRTRPLPSKTSSPLVHPYPLTHLPKHEGVNEWSKWRKVKVLSERLMTIIISTVDSLFLVRTARRPWLFSATILCRKRFRKVDTSCTTPNVVLFTTGLPLPNVVYSRPKQSPSVRGAFGV